MQTDNKQHTGECSVTELFFSLIRCGIGNETALPYTPTSAQWHELFNIAGKQTLTGIAFAGIKELPKEQRPPKEILLQWFQLSNIIQKKNAGLNRKSTFVAERFHCDGFRNCILKGQGAAQFYPDPTLRSMGDVDFFVNREDIPRAEAVLTSHGYTLRETEHDCHRILDKQGVRLEMHYAIPGVPTGEAGSILNGYLEDLLAASILTENETAACVCP